MNKVRIIQDKMDRDMFHIYTEYFFGRTHHKRMLLVATTHGDMLESLFGKEVADEAEAKEDIEALVATHLKEEVD